MAMDGIATSTVKYGAVGLLSMYGAGVSKIETVLPASVLSLFSPPPSLEVEKCLKSPSGTKIYVGIMQVRLLHVPSVHVPRHCWVN